MMFKKIQATQDRFIIGSMSNTKSNEHKMMWEHIAPFPSILNK